MTEAQGNQPTPEPERLLDPSPHEPTAVARPALVEDPSLGGPVGSREILWRGFDLNLAASSDIRRAAILIGLLTLAVVGPAVMSLLTLGDRLAGVRFGLSVDLGTAELLRSVRGPMVLQLFIAVACVLALSIDSQLLAVDVIARRATGRPFALGSSFAIVRLRFWRLLRANVLIGIILLIPRWAVDRLVAPGGVTQESQLVVETILGIVLSIPFAYVATWILLGQVGARDSVRRSWRLARSRPSLAIVIAIVNSLSQTIAVFALGAAVDLLDRIATALGVESPTGGGVLPLAVLIGLGITAAGSLLMTISALTAGPAVVAFLRVTGIASGLDALHDPDNPFAGPRRAPLVTRPMAVAIAVQIVLMAMVLLRLA